MSDEPREFGFVKSKSATSCCSANTASEGAARCGGSRMTDEKLKPIVKKEVSRQLSERAAAVLGALVAAGFTYVEAMTVVAIAGIPGSASTMLVVAGMDAMFFTIVGVIVILWCIGVACFGDW